MTDTKSFFLDSNQISSNNSNQDSPSKKLKIKADLEAKNNLDTFELVDNNSPDVLLDYEDVQKRFSQIKQKSAKTSAKIDNDVLLPSLEEQINDSNNVLNSTNNQSSSINVDNHNSNHD